MKADLLLQQLGLMGLLAGTLNAAALTTVVHAEPMTPRDGEQITPATLDESAASTIPTETVRSIQAPAAAPTAPEAATAPLDTQEKKQTPAASVEISSTQVRILSPAPNELLDIPSAPITLQFIEGQTVDLQVNGVSVDPKLIGRTETNNTTKVVTQTWYGVTLREGDNTITAQIKDGTAQANATATKVQVRGIPQQLKVETVTKRIPADGRSTTVIRGQLVDAQGNRSNRDALITLTPEAGEFIGADTDKDQVGYQVQARQGQFEATLRSGLQAQTAKVRASTGEIEAFVQVEFETSLRPSIATGVLDVRFGARGTDYYSGFREFLPADRDNTAKIDLRSAVFASGKIGDWLFTGAYNSNRALNQDCNGTTRFLRDAQVCDQQYPVYGDSSTSTRVAQSQDSVFLRLERNQDFITWADYNTQELATASQEFTAINRQLHGLKLNYNAGNFQFTGFYGDNVQGFQRDTLPPDGTSGYYFVSRRLLVAGSENVSVETQELNRPGTVLERKVLTRGVDYDIDYDRGSLLFRQPLLRTDVDAKTGTTLVRQLVVTYQYESQQNANIYGGRVRYHFSKEQNKESWLGATYFRENQGVRHFELYGADALIPLSPKFNLIAEYARSTNDSDLLGPVSGSAYRLEAKGELFGGVQSRTYWRSAETGFANNATISFVPGQTRYGTELTAQVAPTTNLHLQYDHEDNVGVAPQPLSNLADLLTPRTQALPGSGVNNSLTTITAGVQQKFGQADLTVDWLNRNRVDQATEQKSISSQLRTRFSVPVADKLTFRAQNELNLGSTQDAIYPDRTTLGLEWAVYPGVSIQLNQNFIAGGSFGSNSFTSLDTKADYKLAENTTLSGRYSILSGINGLSSQGALGLNHRWVVSPGLRVNLGYERVFGDAFATTNTGTQFAQPFAAGQGVSALGVQSGDNYNIGFEYTDNPDFKASARYEYRTSAAGTNTVLTASAAGKITPSLTALLRYNQAGIANQSLSGLGDTTNLKLGIAYRDPKDDTFNALLRYEYRKNPSIIPENLLLGVGTSSQDHTLALEAIYAPSWQWELYGKYALRSSSTQLDQNFTSSSLISLAQLRTTYRFAYNFDFVGEARWISQPQAGYSEMGAVAEVGYYLSPNLRLAAGYSFGHINDRDFGGTRAAGGAYLGLTVKVNELFDGFGLQKVVPPQQQESQLAQAPLNPVITPVQAPQARQFFAPQGVSFMPPSTPSLLTVSQIQKNAETKMRADLIQYQESSEALGTLEELHVQ
jgi:hypothetical protein